MIAVTFTRIEYFKYDMKIIETNQLFYDQMRT